MGSYPQRKEGKKSRWLFFPSFLSLPVFVVNKIHLTFFEKYIFIPIDIVFFLIKVYNIIAFSSGFPALSRGILFYKLLSSRIGYGVYPACFYCWLGEIVLYHKPYRSSRYSHQRALRKRRRNIVLSVAVILAVAVGGTVLGVHMLTPKTSDSANVTPQTSVSDDPAISSLGENPSSITASTDPDPLAMDTSFAQWNQSCDWTMIVVNAYNPLPDSWDENRIVYTESLSPCGLDERIVDIVQEMVNDAYADGVSIWLSSGYRSKEKQAELFQQEIQGNIRDGMDQKEAEAQARKLVMPAGYSEHQTGLVIDINGVNEDFYQTKAYQWMCDHASDYGFIERYPQGKDSITGINYEPWHYRYVGVENAKAIEASGLCLEEYVYQQMNG